jgi:wobble nucleotide-excising tRNase
MITNLRLNKLATFTEEVVVEPRRINYVYGGNGSGKTSISRLIANPSCNENCSITWKDKPLHCLVYNRDFVKDNFEQDEIKGIFTLGKNVPEARKKIDEKRNEINKCEELIQTLTNSKNAHNEKQQEELSLFTEECWDFKIKYADSLKNCLTGTMGSKNAFRDKCLKEQENDSELCTYQYLIDQHKSLYETELLAIDQIIPIKYDLLLEKENAKIFDESIVGKNQSQIGELINYLGNSDWVNTGIAFQRKTTKNECPFCQRPMEAALVKTIEDYFDQTYIDKGIELKKATDEYIEYTSIIIEGLENINKREIPIFIFSQLSNYITSIKAIVDKNINELNRKNNQKSQIIVLDSIKDNIDGAMIEINACIEKIFKHNQLIINISTEREKLKNQVWRFIAEEAKATVNRYIVKRDAINKAIEGIEIKLDTQNTRLVLLKKELVQIESSITSVKHTVNEINRILRGFHFNGFSISESDRLGYYQIIRTDGSIANKTLSEGEYTFISFLYFYQLIKGSIDKENVENNRIVIIDDPISSLDSNVLFIVSNLVKSLIDECLTNYRKTMIKQIFIMTHNLYFHKEVSFKGSRESTTKNELFWLVYKTNEVSKIKVSTKNPINTTYALLWDEVKNSESTNRITIFNSLRRILEYYFKIIGDYNYEEIVNKFEFEDMQTCKALISWINDGSHFINDDLLVETEIESVDRYLKVFKDIFEKLGHLSHYNMMMKI